MNAESGGMDGSESISRAGSFDPGYCRDDRVKPKYRSPGERESKLDESRATSKERYKEYALPAVRLVEETRAMGYACSRLAPR